MLTLQNKGLRMSFMSGNELSNTLNMNKNDLPFLREEKRMPFTRRGNAIYYLSSFEDVIKSRDILTSSECKILSISNNKGGVRKTTGTINIGSSLAFYGYKVLLIDMDAQCNLTSLMKVRGKSIVDAINGGELEISNIKNDIYRYGRLDVVGNDFSNELEFGFDYKKLESVIDKVKKKYDIIIIDTPPQVKDVTLQCLKVSDFVFVPLLPDELSTIGAVKLLDILGNYDIKLLGGMITSNHKNYSTDIASIANLQKIFIEMGSRICPTYISDSTIFNEIAIMRDKNSILEYQPRHKCTAEYLQVTDYIVYSMLEVL